MLDAIAPTLAGLAACASAASLVFALHASARRYRARFSIEVSQRLERGFVFVETQRALSMVVLLAITLALIALVATGSVLAAAGAAAVAGVVPRIAVARMLARRRERFRHQLPEVLVLMAGGLRAGNGLALMFAQIAEQVPAPAGQEFTLMQREQRMGATLDRALSGLERRMPVEETTLLAAALRLGHASGGGVAEALDTLADATRRKLAIEGRVRALTAQGRLQAWVMAALPFALVALLAVVEPGSAAALTRTWQGALTCAGVIVWQSIGLYFIRRIVAIEI